MHYFYAAHFQCTMLIIGPKRSTLQAMLVNLDGEDDVPALQSGSHSPPRTGSADIDDNSRLYIAFICCIYSHVHLISILNLKDSLCNFPT